MVLKHRVFKTGGETRHTQMNTPLGPLLIAGGDLGLRALSFLSGSNPVHPASEWIADASPVREAMAQLDAYFAGELRTFSLPLEPQGTPFQHRVWAALREIPYGQTRSYGELALSLGRQGAARAVGAANGSNPLPIVVPCHRVIGQNGALTGYAGGLPIKKALLELEGISLPASHKAHPAADPRQSRLF